MLIGLLQCDKDKRQYLYNILNTKNMVSKEIRFMEGWGEVKQKTNLFRYLLKTVVDRCDQNRERETEINKR